MNGITDDEIRARFAVLRERDKQIEPGLETLSRAASSRLTGPRHFARPVPWMVAAASILVVAAVVIGRTRDRIPARQTVSQGAVISNWRSPTAGLLQKPSTSVLVSRPLLSSVFDGVASPLSLKTD